jgi:DNA polymerase III epsilon subunit-like protein
VKAENLICVFDVETNGLDTDTCNVVEFACLFLDPKKLTVVPGSEFASLARPPVLETVDDTPKKVEALAVSGITRNDLRGAPVEEAVARAFAAHVKKVCGRKKAVPAGYNIENFDLPLYDRLCRQYGLTTKGGANPSFLTGLVLDMKQDVNRFWYNDEEKLTFPSFDNVRKFFGMSVERAHRAWFDVQQEAWLVVKMLNLYQDLRGRIHFAGSARGNGGFVPADFSRAAVPAPTPPAAEAVNAA